jgi:hypothetical protein
VLIDTTRDGLCVFFLVSILLQVCGSLMPSA